MDRFRSFVRRGLSLETFKFTLYLAIPAGITVALLYPGQVNRLVSHFPFVVYPPEDPTIREANDRFRQQQLEALERQSREAEQKAKQQQ